MSVDRSVLANMHPCIRCGKRASYVVVLPYGTTPFLVCGTHRRAYAALACYRLNLSERKVRSTPAAPQPALTVERPMKWNQDKPHRCPSCHTVAVPGSVGRPQRGVVYTCCRCSARFSSSPSRRKMPERGVVCAHHVPATCRPGGERP